jgi:quinate dehydrogenase
MSTHQASASNEDTIQASYKYGTSPLTPSSLTTPHETFLIGYPIAHSMAPLLHSTLFKGLNIPWTYKLLESKTSEPFLPSLKSPNVIGCAVTMPYKVSLLPSVDAVTDEARILGAINTVFLRKDAAGETRYIGTNTDTIGVRESLVRNFPDILEHSVGKPGLIIGGGGACRSAVYALWKWFGVSKIYIVNRLRSEAEAIIADFNAAEGFDGELMFVGSVEEAKALEAPVVVVGTVPDFPPKEEGEKVAAECTKVFMAKEKKGYVLEMCYHPNPRTAFFELCEKEGWKVIPGTEAMIYQGVAQQILWTEMPLEKFPVEEASKVIKEALAKHH